MESESESNFQDPLESESESDFKDPLESESESDFKDPLESESDFMVRLRLLVLDIIGDFFQKFISFKNM